MAPAPLSQQLTELSGLLARMCAASANSLQQATVALLERRQRLATHVAVAHESVTGLRTQLEALGSEALLFHQPVAGDLRVVVSSIRSAGDVERMSRLALSIAQIAARRYPAAALPPQLHDEFAEMGRLAVALGLKAADVVCSRNVLRAVELDADDDAMDRLHVHVLEVLMDPAWPHGVAAAVDITLLARYYERFADHAVVVARETIYAVTGQQPDSLPI